MSFTRNITLAGAFAFALLATSAAPADSGRPVGHVAIATAPATADVTRTIVPIAQSLRLTSADMTAVHGDGLWGWIKKTVKKIDRWIRNNADTIRRIWE